MFFGLTLNHRVEEVAGSAGVTKPFSLGLYSRILTAGLLLAIEVIVLSMWLDTATLNRRTGLVRFIADWGPELVRSIIAGVLVASAVALQRADRLLKPIHEQIEFLPIAWTSLAAHVACAVIFGRISWFLFFTNSTGSAMDMAAAFWLGVGICMGTLCITTFLPPRALFLLLREFWLYGLLAAGFTLSLVNAARLLWGPSAILTFRLARFLLSPFAPGVVSNPEQRILGTERFNVIISPQCAGLEGVGLILLFGIFMLWLGRDELRFPRALLFFPAGVIVIWLLNAVRIVALILIGDSGAPQIALGGFHSQAGWIVFNCVALGLTFGFRRIRWFTTVGTGVTMRSRNPTVPYLLPLLAILGAAMISRAASSGVEWLYPLRFFAGGLVILHFRHKYQELDWRVSWFAWFAGFSTFFLWLGLEQFSGVHTANPLGSALNAAPAWMRFGWIAFRVLAAVVTVPVAEELAFRCFLIRRLVSVDFEFLDARRYSPFAVAVSSIAFGLLHGDRWIAGSLAGVIYALTFLRRGRIGDAVAAHALTNALLAILVLSRGTWNYW